MIALGLHSFYSLMRGVASPHALCHKAKALGYTTLGLTDSNNLYGLWPFLACCRQEGLRPIIGSELRTADNRRLFIQVKDQRGFRHLCRLLSKRHLDEKFSLERELATHHQGLLLLATDAAMLRHGREIEADMFAGLAGGPSQHNSSLRQQATKLGLASVALQDSYFLSAEDEPLHRIVRAIGLNTSFDRLPPDAWSRNGGLPSAAAWRRRFAIWPEVLQAAEHIAERCELNSPYQGVVMPPWSGDDAARELRQRAFSGAKRRYGQPLAAEVCTRLEHELKVIESMGFSSYFLVVHDIVGPVARTCGRGSGAASLVAYCLHITNVCPLRHNLYFERFLNPGRTDPPDIDIDFAWDERDAMLRSVLDTFGCRAAMVANHVSLQPRAAIRETAKVFGLPDAEINGICKKLPWTWRGHAFSDNFLAQLRQLPQLRSADFSGPWPMILHLAARISGTPRNLSVHPGGVVITPNPIFDYAPVEQAAKGVPIIQWEKDGAEEAGLVKIDLLGNRSLAVIRDALGQVRAEGMNFDESRWLPEADPATQRTVASGRTMGCFYIESPATRLLQQRSQRGDFHHLVIHSSIIRPAANEFIREYLRRLHGGNWNPLHPLIGNVLDETYGIMVYQEDVSRVAVQFGFSHTDADRLRKIMSKKDTTHQLQDYRQQFFDAAMGRGASVEVAEKIWAMMMSFHGYSFCKPHSASYAKVSFQAAYLKTHFPAEFMAAVLSNQGGFYSAFAYVSEARRLGLEVLPPCVNQSQVPWQGRGKTLRVGLMAITGAGESCKRSVLVRAQGKFQSVSDWLSRVQPGRDEAQAFVHAGALDALHPQAATNRGLLIWLVTLWFQGKKQHRSLFPLDPSPPSLPAEDPRERLRNQYRILGFLCHCHPITLFAQERQRQQTLTARELVALPAGAVRLQKRRRFIAWLITGKLVSTKKGEAMEFLSFEDETGLMECTLFSKAYSRYCHLLSRCGPFLLSGYLDEDFGTRTFTIEHLQPLRLGHSGGIRRQDIG